jgi:hypothetical protein
MLSRLRLLLAWLVMAALPLQGFAAATMAFCDGAHHERTPWAGETVPLAHAVDARGAPHDQSGHSHAAHAQAFDDDGATQAAHPDANHKCGVCASCCHSIALAEIPQWPALAPLPQAGLSEPVLLIHAAPSALPDKPPRA